MSDPNDTGLDEETLRLAEAGVTATNPWFVVGRPGYVGRRVGSAIAALDDRHGPGHWRIAYRWGDRVIEREEALGLYGADDPSAAPPPEAPHQ